MTNKRSERGRMIVGLTQVIRTRKTDLDHTPRWTRDTLVRVSRPEKRVYRVTYRTNDEEEEEYLSTSQMSIAEMTDLLAFVKDMPEPSPDPVKPKVKSKLKITGMEALEQKYRPAPESPITETVRSTAPVMPEIKYRVVKVTKTYVTVHTETYHLKFTEKTLDEFKAMRDGNEEDQQVFNYLLRKQTERCDPATVRESDPSRIEFAIED